jgi:DNA-binding response OmpR family regulator
MNNFSSITLLIVDDDSDLREILVSIFEAEGSVTISASGGYEALEKLKSNKVDLVITDMRMPKGSGYDLIREVRGDETYNSLPIIVVTGYSDVRTSEMLEIGANALIPKPFNISQLFETVENCLKDSAS